MSKKHRRQRKGFPWPVLIFGGIVLIAGALLLANWPGGGGNDDSGGTPAIAVDPQKIDYGYVKFGNDETFQIKVTNTGSGTLRFKTKPFIQVLEGC